MIKIRNAVFEDKEILQKLSIQLGYPLTDDEINERLSLFIEAKERAIFVSLYEEKVIGAITCHLVEQFVRPIKIVRITSLVVDENYRRFGAGRSLMQRVEDWAFEKGARKVELTSGKRRAPTGAHDFYNKLGYTNEGYYAKIYLTKTLE